MMHPDFDCPENHLAREPFPVPDTTCTDCHGTRVLDGEPCVYCDGKGYVEERQVSYPDLKARVRLDERLLSEPGFAMAFLFLLDQKGARHRAEIERAALGKAA